MTLTARQKMLMRAALSYALSNIDDINDSFADDDGEGVKVGDQKGDSFSEAEVEALQSLVDGENPPATANATILTTTADGVRAFRGSFLVAIVESEADEDFDEDDGDGDGDDGDDGDPAPVTLDAVKDYLKDALNLDIDTEEYGNPVGFQSAELLWDTMTELPPDEVARLYNK